MSDDKVLVSRVLLEKWRTRFRSAQMFTQSTEISEVLAQPSDGALTNEGAEPVAWVNGEQLRLCIRSPLDESNLNPAARHLPRNIGGSALKGSYCDTPLYRHPPNVCTCPSGDGSLRWPCPVHPPEVKAPVAVVDESDDGLFVEFIYGEDGNPLQRGDKLYRSPPAPTSLALPSRSDFEKYIVGRDGELWVFDTESGRDYDNDASRDFALWSACLDRVKELNS